MQRANSESIDKRYLYWFTPDAFASLKLAAPSHGIKLTTTVLTPCQVLRVSPGRAIYAPPSVWSRMCVRQGSWYRDSQRAGQYMAMSAERLPAMFDRYLDAEVAESDFVPASLPGNADLEGLVDSSVYKTQKPDEWEAKGILDAVMFKVFFTVNRLWGRADNLKKHWLAHRAHHANFLAAHFTTEIDGEAVPYSIAENAGICSSCVETFNIIAADRRKLVRACPGAVTFGGARRDVYLDIKPIHRPAAAA